MVMKTMTFVGVVLLAACGSAKDGGEDAQAQTIAVTAPQRDIAGVNVAMTVPQAIAVLRGSGWAIDREPGKSWEQHVEGEVSVQRGGLRPGGRTPEAGSVHARKGDENVHLEVRPSPQGGAIETITYYAPLAGRSFEELGRTLVERYGVPTTGRPSAAGLNFKWCGSQDCRSAAYLSAYTRPSEQQLRVIAFWGGDRHGAWDREVERAIAEKMGTARSSF